MSADLWTRYIFVLFVITVVLGVIGGIGIGVARWARQAGHRPWIWVLGAYAAASLAWAIVSSYVR